MTASARATLAYTVPFLAYVGLMAAERVLGVPPAWGYAVRCAAAVAAIAIFSRGAIPRRPSHALASVGVGIVVFLIWIGPDALFGPGYRHSLLFENSLTGRAEGTLPAGLLQNPGFLALRTLGSLALVPVLEELFWRGWLMRWIINSEFLKVPVGQYAPAAFWTVAALFAAEHGSYWEVGFLAGIVYNWWVVRTRNLADAVLAHAVTNGLLAAYVIAFGRWQYWL
jgi:uncharacterized protein